MGCCVEHEELCEADVPKRQMGLAQAVSPVQYNPVVPQSLKVTPIYPAKNLCWVGMPDEGDLLCWGVATEW